MSDLNNDTGTSLIDRSVKRLFRDQPHTLLRLTGIPQDAVNNLRFEDCNLNILELRADHVLLFEQQGMEYALYFEYQTRPEPEKRVLWAIKWAALCRELGMPVILVVVYLEKGEYATFHDSYAQNLGNLETKLSFNVVRLWEYRDRIERGELPELAPLLILCEAQPSEETLRQELRLIRQSGLPRSEQAELIGVAALLASRKFRRDILHTIFVKEMTMLEEVDEGYEFMELLAELGVLDKWASKPSRFSEILSARGKAEGEAKGKAEGLAEGKAEGLSEGKLLALRENTLSLLTQRFGEVPPSLKDRIESLDAEQCQELFNRAINATSLEQLV